MNDEEFPVELNRWCAAVATELALPILLDAAAIAALLDLTKVLAHAVARPAAPLAIYLLGVAHGRGSGGHPDASAVDATAAVALRLLAASWPPPGQAWKSSS